MYLPELQKGRKASWLPHKMARLPQPLSHSTGQDCTELAHTPD